MRKRVLAALLALYTVLAMLPGTAFAATYMGGTTLPAGKTFTVNGKTISASSGTSVRNCSAYAGEVLGKIWKVNAVMTTYNGKYNMLKGKSAADRTVTAAHTKAFIQDAPLGSRIRVCNDSGTTANNYDNNRLGHTMVLVEKDSAAGTFTVLHAGWGGSAATEYTYSGFANYYAQKTNPYKYFFYIANYSAADPSSTENDPGTANREVHYCLQYTSATSNPHIGFTSDVFKKIKGPTGNLTHISFSPPSANSGALYYCGKDGYRTHITSSAVWYDTTHMAGSLHIDDVIFVPSANYSGILSIPFEAYDEGMSKFSGVVKIEVINAKGSLTLTFNPNGGLCSTASKKVIANAACGTLPTPHRTGYTFSGWYTAKSGGKKVTASTKATANATLYAHWTKAKRTYQVAFNANGGDVLLENKSVVRGSAYQALPTPTRPGYHFTGWYTKASGGVKITDKTKVNLTANQTLYAHWSTAAVKAVSTKSGNWRISVPLYYNVMLYSSNVSASPAAYISEKSSAQTLVCTRMAVLSNGTTRYYTKQNGTYYWFTYTCEMDVN